jgi:membrane protein implicated in regulation of membrane protease activity
MYLVGIGWLYVAFMMALVEATSPQGSVLGAAFTFLMYGVVPVSLLLYILGTPGRKRRLREAQRASEVDPEKMP